MEIAHHHDVKEPQLVWVSALGTLATTAAERLDMVEHISNLKKLQEELQLMEHKVPDGSDHILPESWTPYYLGSGGN